MYKLMIGHELNFSDLETVDKGLYVRMHHLLQYSPEKLEDCYLTFTVIANDFGGEEALHELIPGGKDILVTKDNVQVIYLKLIL
jgi:hypothetical protein